MLVGGLVPRIVKQLADIGVQRAVIGLEGQHVVTSFSTICRADLALTVERVGGHNRALQR
jgi:hypothetical protein